MFQMGLPETASLKEPALSTILRDSRSVNTNPFTRAIEIIEGLGGNPQNGMCACPAHDDDKPSLHVSEGRKGPVWKCHAGCDQDEVANALRSRKLWPEKSTANPSTKPRLP